MPSIWPRGSWACVPLLGYLDTCQLVGVVMSGGPKGGKGTSPTAHSTSRMTHK